MCSVCLSGLFYLMFVCIGLVWLFFLYVPSISYFCIWKRKKNTLQTYFKHQNPLDVLQFNLTGWGRGVHVLKLNTTRKLPIYEIFVKVYKQKYYSYFFVIALGGNDLNRYSHFYFFTISYVIMCLFVFLNTALRQKMTVFGQDIYNRHGYKCTHTNKRVLGHWKASFICI